MKDFFADSWGPIVAALLKLCFVCGSVLASLLGVQTAYAHEVYVLKPAEVQSILATTSPNPFQQIPLHQSEFFTWAFIGVMTVSIVFLVSVLRPLERKLDPFLFRLKRKSGFIIIRLTIGLSLLASGYYGAMFGPELPLSSIFGPYASLASILLMIIGGSIVIGFLTRPMGIAALLLALFVVYHKGVYLFTYANYMGDIVFVAFLGAHVWSIDKHVLHWHGLMGKIERFVEHYAFLMLRITFGLSLIYASVWAKFIHSELALQTVLQYNLTDYFHFAPMFIVLGAGLVEITIGTFIILGVEVRFTSLFLMFFLTLSLLYFGEAVWPHIVLFGGALALFVHGYDRYTIEGYFFKDAQHEPIL